MEEKINKFLDKMRPILQNDGGDVEFIQYKNKYVYIKLLGGCAHCVHRNETIKYAIYEELKKEIPEIEGIINVEI